MSLSDRDLETLSAYLDGEISRKDRERLEARFHADEDLRDSLEQLRRTREVTRSSPSIRAPRNYYLTPEMVGRVEPTRRAYPVLRLAAAFASVLFVLLVIGDLFTVPRVAMSPIVGMQSAETSAEFAEPPMAEAEEFESQAPEGMEDRAMESAPLEAEAPAPALESESVYSAETPMDMQKLLATGTPALREESIEGAVGESQEEAGVIAEPVEEPQIQTERRVTVIAVEVDTQPGINLRVVVRILEVVLALAAISTGLGAFLLYRRDKFG